MTGLITVDTAVYWSPFGQAVILLLFEIGGFGIMTGAVLLGMIAGRDFRLRDRLVTRVERDRLERGNARSVIYLVFVITLAVEAVVAIVLMLRLRLAYGANWTDALWSGIFHSVSAFNNAGFSIYSNGLMDFQHDAWILGSIMTAVVIASLGFPVIQEIRNRPFFIPDLERTQQGDPDRDGPSAFRRLVFILTAEWSNPETLGPMEWDFKLLNAAFHSVMPRTAGFNSLDIGAFRLETLSFNYILMFIGGGSAGTAGGIKITTFFSPPDGDLERDSRRGGCRGHGAPGRQSRGTPGIGGGCSGNAFHRRRNGDPAHGQRISAFGHPVRGLLRILDSRALDRDNRRAAPGGQITLIVLMYVGRVGTITVATALALRRSRRPYRYPEENPIVG